MARRPNALSREMAERRTQKVLDADPVASSGLRAMTTGRVLEMEDGSSSIEAREARAIKSAHWRRVQALVDMPGTRTERAERCLDYLVGSGVLEPPPSNKAEWRVKRFLHRRNLGDDKLQAVWAVKAQEGPEVSEKTVLRTLQSFRSQGGEMKGWHGEDFSDLPGLSAEELRAPKQQEK